MKSMLTVHGARRRSSGDMTTLEELNNYVKALNAVVDLCAPDEQDDIDLGVRLFKQALIQAIETELKWEA